MGGGVLYNHGTAKVGKGFKMIPSNLVPEDTKHDLFPTYLLAWNFDAFPRFFGGLIWLLLSCFPLPPVTTIPASCWLSPLLPSLNPLTSGFLIPTENFHLIPASPGLAASEGSVIP